MLIRRTLDYDVNVLPLEQVAHILARACGHWGSGAQYLHQTVSKLEEFGIHDENLWKLQELVAEEIRSLIPLIGDSAGVVPWP